MDARTVTAPFPPLGKLARAAAYVSIAVGLAGLVGVWLDIRWLQSTWPGRPLMPPHSALCFVLLGAALWLVLPGDASLGRKIPDRVAQLLGAISVLVAVLGFVEIHSGVDLGIDDLARIQEHLRHGSKAGGYPSVLCGVGIGLSLVLLESRMMGIWLSEVIAVVAAQIAVLALFGHLFGVAELYGSPTFLLDAGMSVNASAGFAILSVGLLCARSDRGLMAVLRSQTPGGTMARRWLGFPVLLLLLVGIVYIGLVRTQIVDRAVASWAQFAASLILLTVAVWSTASKLHRAGLEQEQAQLALESRVRERTAELRHVNEALQAARDELAAANQHLEQTVQERTAHLKETINSLETVCYNIAHHLRAPNRAIIGYSELLLRERPGQLDATAKEYVEKMAAAARRSDMLTMDLLAYGRLGHVQLPCGKEPLQHYIDTVLKDLKQEIKSAAASIEVPEPLPEVWANPLALEQVLFNLVANALKFARDGVPPRIIIRAEDAGLYWRILVEDNGIGIRPGDQQFIFGVFQRLHGSGKYPGSGIGLAIVQKSIERMAGRVGVKSSPESGSCFWFELRKSGG